MIRIFLSILSLALFAVGEESSPLQPYSGSSHKGVDCSTLNGKVMTGYQGWFGSDGDRMGMGWVHWSKHRSKPFGPGNATVDLWPDMSEYSAQYPTDFKLADGSEATVFSSTDRSTVLKHFEWMQDYGIHGAFVQRFANGLNNTELKLQKDMVLSHAREGANRFGRAYVVMYDLSGLSAGGAERVWEDWQELREKMDITGDPAYLHHNGKPLVSIWGVGFNDGDKPRQYSVAECGELVEKLKADGCSVMLGVPTGWRELERDSVADPALHEVIKLADVVSPWTIGRYRDEKSLASHAEKHLKPDVKWCRENGLDYFPVVFPGFSWYNLHGDELNAIPREGGQFLWSQMVEAKKAGANMIYVAMFDEVDEGTAIFKCTNDVPVGEGVTFLTYEGLPADHYLKLVGAGQKMLRGEIPATDKMPGL
tara:strand:+ start:252 stop:1520 length:1269 start_codon:yes stop_codon:yes gene_type:complete